MSSKWFWGLLVVFLVGGLSAGVLYRRFRIFEGRGEQQGESTGQVENPPVQTFGSLLLTYSSPPLGGEMHIPAVVMNKLTIEDYKLDVVEVKGKENPVLNLSVSFDYQGGTRKLTIPVVEKILARRSGAQGKEELGTLSVVDINLEKGKPVNLALAYISKENVIKKNELIQFCEDAQYESCLIAISLGFGDEPIDFESYLQSILENRETAKTDYKFVFPSAITF